MTEPAVLVLEDGRTFRGRAYGAEGTTLGEIVFTTGMTGYQETLTDPSYHRQIVVQTAPHIGNTGVNDEDDESRRIWVAGYVVRDPSRGASNWRARRTLDDELVAQGIVGISGIDTRALTRHLRERGAMRAGIFSGAADARRPTSELLRRRPAAPQMAGADLSPRWSPPPSLRGRAGREQAVHRRRPRPRHQGHDAAAHGRARHARARAAARRRRIDDVLRHEPGRRLLLQRPGRPGRRRRTQVELLREVLDARIPFFGICFGNQLLGRALGYGTYKLRLRPPRRQPAGDGPRHGQGRDHRAQPRLRRRRPARRASSTARTATAGSRSATSASTTTSSRACARLDVPAFSVQYHPEAAAGPHDAAYLFDRFADLMIADEEGGA